MSQPKVIIRTEYSPTYKQIPVTAFFSTLSDKGFELTAYIDEDDYTPEGGIQPGIVYLRRTIETRLAINPMQMKLLHQLVGRQLETYEKTYGKIPSPEEVTSRFAEMTKERQHSGASTSTTKPSVGIQ